MMMKVIEKKRDAKYYQRCIIGRIQFEILKIGVL